MRKIPFVAGIFCLLAFVFSASASAQSVTQGALEAVGKDGKPIGACPLKHTAVKAEISGFLTRVRVRQEFENNFAEKIEAVYVFPLSNRAAVDEMTMHVGARTVRGKILRREEARDVYEAARNDGQAAALLDQERPNIFTQSIANILPGEKVTIEIAYVETLKYENGMYEFVFPTVVAPRYIPGAPVGKQAGGFAPDTTQVPDASRITPQIAETRAGHDISIEINLDAGIPLESVRSKSHQIESALFSASRAIVKLKSEREIPNKDFVLRYDVSGKKIADAVLTHRSERGGFFTLILQPPDEPRTEDVTPKEIVFVLDTSGSMSGFPIEKAKEAMQLALDGLNPNDTFNLITFAGDTHILFKEPVAATRVNLAKAQAFLKERKGAGGTEMMTAIKAALDPTDSQQHVRVVCFMTDGHVGNDNEIIAEVQKHKNARVFSFGIGGSTNRFLLDKIAEEGRGEAGYVGLDDDGSAAAKRFHERVRSPLLTDVSVDWNGLPVADVYPRRIEDLFSAKPVVVHGRFTNAANGTIKLKGKVAGREVVREIAVNFPENEPQHNVLATLWARSRVDDLTKQDYENQKPEIKDAITNLGLEFRLLTQFTSFVAVEEMVTTEGGQPRRIDVPVEMPAGMSRETTFSSEADVSLRQVANLPANGRTFSALQSVASTVEVSVTAESSRIDMTDSSVKTVINPRALDDYRPSPKTRKSENTFVIDGQEAANFRTGALNESSKTPKVVSGGVLNGKAKSLPKPIYPAAAKAVRASGAVNVQVTIDEKGDVFAAEVTSGHPLLRAAALQAARAAKFTAVIIGGSPIRFVGTIVYNFEDSGKKSDVATTLENFAVELTPEQRKLRALATKTAPAIFALLDRLIKGETQPAPDEAKFVADGKAEIRVYLTDKTPAAIEELKNAGFELLLDPTTAKFVIGRIPLDKLASLSELASVSFVAPQSR